MFCDICSLSRGFPLSKPGRMPSAAWGVDMSPGSRSAPQGTGGLYRPLLACTILARGGAQEQGFPASAPTDITGLVHTAGCGAAPLVSVHQMPGTPTAPSHDNPRCPQTLPNARRGRTGRGEHPGAPIFDASPPLHSGGLSPGQTPPLTSTWHLPEGPCLKRNPQHQGL